MLQVRGNTKEVCGAKIVSEITKGSPRQCRAGGKGCVLTLFLVCDVGWKGVSGMAMTVQLCSFLNPLAK